MDRQRQREQLDLIQTLNREHLQSAHSDQGTNVDRGVEDTILRDDLYARVMRVFLKRIEMKKANVYQS